jgi:hypothetical protein
VVLVVQFGTSPCSSAGLKGVALAPQFCEKWLTDERAFVQCSGLYHES